MKALKSITLTSVILCISSFANANVCYDQCTSQIGNPCAGVTNIVQQTQCSIYVQHAIAACVQSCNTPGN